MIRQQTDQVLILYLLKLITETTLYDAISEEKQAGSLRTMLTGVFNRERLFMVYLTAKMEINKDLVQKPN